MFFVPIEFDGSGDDLRIWVDAVEIERWLDAPQTNVWVNLDWSEAERDRNEHEVNDDWL